MRVAAAQGGCGMALVLHPIPHSHRVGNLAVELCDWENSRWSFKGFG